MPDIVPLSRGLRFMISLQNMLLKYKLVARGTQLCVLHSQRRYVMEPSRAVPSHHARYWTCRCFVYMTLRAESTMTDALSELDDPAGEHALTIFTQGEGRETEDIHRNIAKQRKYEPAFFQRRAEIDKAEVALCALRKRHAMLALVSRDMQQGTCPGASLRIWLPRLVANQIKSEISYLLKDMVRYRCAYDNVEVREDIYYVLKSQPPLLPVCPVQARGFQRAPRRAAPVELCWETRIFSEIELL